MEADTEAGDAEDAGERCYHGGWDGGGRGLPVRQAAMCGAKNSNSLLFTLGSHAGLPAAAELWCFPTWLTAAGRLGGGLITQ